MEYPSSPPALAAEPSLPSTSLARKLPKCLKRRFDELVENSSDPPEFSSDDVPANCENYARPCVKRVRPGPWWSSSQQTPDDSSGEPKRAFRRNFDSGVWMRSDSVESDLEPAQLLRDVQAVKSLSFTTPSATQEPDPQAVAAQMVQRCVEAGTQTIDLSSMDLQSIATATLEPLKYMVAPVPSSQAPPEEAYDSLVPDISLFLGDNKLREIPQNLCALENITRLSLWQNNLTELPPSIRNLTRLREINIGGNQLRYLPWELLEMQKTQMMTVLAWPNPMLLPVSSNTSAAFDDDWSATSRPIKDQKLDYRVVACTDVAYLGVGGHVSAGSAAPSKTHDAKARSRTNLLPKAPAAASRVPSLLETALRSCAAFGATAPLTDLLPIEAPTQLGTLLQQMRTTLESGGQQCSVCNQQYFVPRTEWIQWVQFRITPDKPKPFLRRGCSWACVSDAANVHPDWKGCGWAQA